MSINSIKSCNFYTTGKESVKPKLNKPKMWKMLHYWVAIMLVCLWRDSIQLWYFSFCRIIYNIFFWSFQLENDVANYLYVKMMGGKTILKKDVVPHKFECQGRLQPLSKNRIVLARKRKIQEILKDKGNIGEFIHWSNTVSYLTTRCYRNVFCACLNTLQ